MPDTHVATAPEASSFPPGHNNPPAAEVLHERLTQQYGHLLTTREECLAGVATVPAVIEDDETAGSCGDLIKKMTALVKVAEAGKDAEKAPIIEAGNVVMGFFASVWDPIKKAHRELNDRMTKFGREKAEREKRERERIAREAEAEAQRLADEAAFQASLLDEVAKIGTGDVVDVALGNAITAEELARQAVGDVIVAQRATTAKAADLSRTRGGWGSVSSLRSFWDFTDFDRERIDLNKLRPHFTEAEIHKALRLFIRAGGRSIDGATIFHNTGNNTR